MRYLRKGRGTGKMKHMDRKRKEYDLGREIVTKRIGVAAKHIEKEYQAGRPITSSIVAKKAFQNRVPVEGLLAELERRRIPII